MMLTEVMGAFSRCHIESAPHLSLSLGAGVHRGRLPTSSPSDPPGVK